MSRGLGRWERMLLHAVYEHPRVARNGRRYVWPSEYASNRTEYVAVQRAARSLIRKGLVRQHGPWANDLEPLPERPPVSVHRWQECGTCERLGGSS